ncbi:putative disease resistance protein At3g14460 [Eucalyptus grandis]|uniref:putative disease resistance protein At3g14460 n=1 Tax=Eucalyptus grandis TaxID=71139 RepID=UPI00192F0043|nr:putative disease resistance protein At3g14460 [Eucalyptus grandis]
MGGIGKTALAQRLYNDVKVSGCFEMRAWVCVSDVFNVLDITKTILRSITEVSNEGEDLNRLQVKLKDSLSGKKFLVVLDDVWNENYGEWTALLKPFGAGAKGSKIIITTRNYIVASITGASSYPLKELSLDNLFPKDYEIERDELVHLWIAEGFFDGGRSKDNILKWGQAHFDELVSKSFLQRSSVNASKFSMHDLLNDLAKSIAGGTCFNSESKLADNEDVASPEKVRYASFTSSCLQFLDIRDTRSLKEMPLSISNLKNLMILSKFVVGPDKGSRLKELKNLSHLQGELFISELQKVEKVRDAVDANLIGKRGLSNLFLHWGENFGNLRNGKHEALVLHYLRPHINLEHLSILHYGGERFPSWLDGPSYSKIVSLCLRDCPNVTLLPPLGQLPSLRELSLEGLHAISTIGPEFYGGKRPFSSLTTLKMEEMLAWKDWTHHAGGQEEDVLFSCLQHLVVRGCHSLVGTLPGRLDLLKKLEIYSSPHLNSSTNVVCLPSLCELSIEDCSEEILKILVNLTSLTFLKIKNIAKLVCFDHGFTSYLVKLKELYVRRCDKLNYLWQNGNEMQNLTCLQSVVIDRCPQFTSFVAGDGEIELSCNLEKIELINCTSLQKLPSKMYTLRELNIENCPKIMGLIISQDNPSSNNSISQLEFLYISKCDSWISFPFVKNRLASLKKLTIWNCERVESLKEITAKSLDSLSINRCENLVSLPRCLHTLSHLTYLEISGCPALEIEDFPLLPITLSVLVLYSVPKMKSLPKEWHRLTSLRWLRISGCENIKRLPEGGLPPNLQEFSILGCENMKQPVREWGLPMLTSLNDLTMDESNMGGERDKVWFPSEEDNEDAWSLLFPSSLTSLWIGHMRNVERLSDGLCKHLSSLQCLGILNCPKLRDLPEDGLPPSLQELHIHVCEILKDRCSKLTGDYWPLIQEIPLIYIDGIRIQ